MSNENSTLWGQINLKAVLVRMLLGGMLGLAVILFFVLSVDAPDPAWGMYWRVRPLIITPLAAAFGTWTFLLGDVYRFQSSGRQLVITLVSILGFFVALWLGVVLGLDGTLWN